MFISEPALQCELECVLWRLYLCVCIAELVCVSGSRPCSPLACVLHTVSMTVLVFVRPRVCVCVCVIVEEGGEVRV